MQARLLLLPLLLTTVPLLAVALPQDDTDEPHIFQRSTSCARCHDASEAAVALWTADGRDASPHGTWEGTMMAQSFFDPYWRAKMAREIEAGDLAQEEIERLCLRCHAPAAVHHDLMVGAPPRSFEDLVEDPFAQDGVTCSVCHRMTAEGLGTADTFDGRPQHDFQARLYGPYPDPAPGPMRNLTGYEVTYGPHMVQSAVCATCHTLTTHHTGKAFPEQTPYFEWRNSEFSYEDEPRETSRSCQACHMLDQGSMRIAHNPGGRDFPFVGERPEVRGHRFVGGNAFMLDLMADHAEELGIPAPPQALRETAVATREQLAHRTAAIAVEDLRRDEGGLHFTVSVENQAGHKLPTGYPGRRVWLEVVVRAGGEVWFASGVPDEQGRIAPDREGLGAPHRDLVRTADEVQVWELVASDLEGQPTTLLTAMATRGKDNRLLPRGWRPDGPHAAETAPVGVDGDKDFVGGGDRVRFALAGVPAGPLEVSARLLYQAVPPVWVDDLRKSVAQDAARFVALYDQHLERTEELARSAADLAD